MATFTIALAEEHALKLKERTEQSGLTPEELLRASVQEWLTRPKQDFEAAAAFVLNKNAELYRRLS